MSDKVKYWLYQVLDFAFTFGGTAGVILYNYLTPDTSTGYKLTLTGIILVVAVVLFAKAVFEKGYREKYDTLLQQLAEATDNESKAAISEAINKHKTANYIYSRLMLLLPFVILYVVTWLGATALSDLHGTVGLIMASMGIGSVFNIIKRPVADRVSLAKITKNKK